MNWDSEMEKALEADGEKLRQLTGEDHGPWPDPDILAEVRNGLAALVEELARREAPGRSKLVLMIAARAVARGRLLTSTEQLANIDRFLADGGAEEPTT